MSANIRTALENRRGTVERARSVEGGMFVVTGLIDLVGVGEATVDVNFPVTFTRKPSLVGSGEVGENEVIVPGAFPEISVGVRRWNRVIRADHPDDPWYDGANLVVVIRGVADDATFVWAATWMAIGPALTNPIVGGLT